MAWRLREVDYDAQGFFGYFVESETDYENFRELKPEVAKIAYERNQKHLVTMEGPAITRRAWFRLIELDLAQKG